MLGAFRVRVRFVNKGLKNYGIDELIGLSDGHSRIPLVYRLNEPP